MSAGSNLRQSLDALDKADMIWTVPNKPKTPTSTFRLPLELKKKAAVKAKAEGKTLTDIVVQGLEDYVGDDYHQHRWRADMTLTNSATELVCTICGATDRKPQGLED